MLPARVFFFAIAFKVRTSAASQARRFDFLAIILPLIINGANVCIETSCRRKARKEAAIHRAKSIIGLRVRKTMSEASGIERQFC
jgi:hypothetical protein